MPGGGAKHSSCRGRRIVIEHQRRASSEAGRDKYGGHGNTWKQSNEWNQKYMFKVFETTGRKIGSDDTNFYAKCNKQGMKSKKMQTCVIPATLFVFTETFSLGMAAAIDSTARLAARKKCACAEHRTYFELSFSRFLFFCIIDRLCWKVRQLWRLSVDIRAAG